METKNCARCGKWFTTIKNTPICSACEKHEEDVFQSVKEYIEENPLGTAAQISEATGVSVRKIIKYIKDGRLEVTKGMSAEITCDSCGKPINKGRYCDSCVVKINQEVGDLFSDMTKSSDESSKDDKNRFYTADSRAKGKKKL